MKYKFSIDVQEVEGQKWHVILTAYDHAGETLIYVYTTCDSDPAVEQWVARQMQLVWGL